MKNKTVYWIRDVYITPEYRQCGWKHTTLASQYRLRMCYNFACPSVAYECFLMHFIAIYVGNLECPL